MRILALDLGERRIGVAVSDPTGTVARPVGVLERKSRAEDFAAIARLVAEHGVERVIVGRPLTLRGEVGPQARWVEAYAQALAEALPVPVELWDERYTTVAAQEILETLRRPGKRRQRGDIDAVAAAVLLQGFLEARSTTEGTETAGDR
ncbi:MAG: Holliday junction resolvase RuvX [Anaerolineae bacterium]|nr:Holliday junction resolvase RuvX [Anaerolineae bacterium]MDW8068490.1 Holliday junction resolvase RuvX [Anaerolineae bacterium]